MNTELPSLVLNQYRSGSSYKDEVGLLYHFPSRYLNSFQSLPARFVYYEPREGGEQEYFGVGVISACYEDTEEDGHYYADVCSYQPFTHAVRYFDGPGGASWEPAKTMRNSVRRIPTELFAGIISSSDDAFDLADPIADSGISRLKLELESIYPSSSKKLSPPKLRRVRRILETFERPNAVTNQVKSSRGDTCQLCGCRGFVMKSGRRYCEVHHLFHLANNPPPECLTPEYLVVLCANCHRRMHYADVSAPSRCEHGWTVAVDSTDHFFKTACKSSDGT